ncbi:cupin domain-containing protein [Hanstruepera flava]|uniref:cupin domain-containing protein n=1 Tax=Hanstruepera flava TaxID=2930218 RepID=UPI002029637E|nr:cupin domain-containing protein [Hanstruepera flava]
MKTAETFWVLGHKVTNYSTTGDYDFALGETPAHTQGPPPHLHNELSETFLITEGEMEFMVNGEIKNVKAGDLVDLPPKTLHTFTNRSDSTCKWINVHSPKGFRGFFEFVGVPVSDNNAQKESITEEKINTVIERAADFDMIIKV